MCRLHVRMVDLSQYAGQTITNFNIFNTTGGAAGNWDIYFGDITLVHTDGTFIPIYSRSMTSLSPFQGPAETALSVITEKVADMTPLTTTTYYHGDHLGSTQLLTAGTGWPVGGDIYYPYGQGPMPGTNHYLFTDKERDTESGLDYFGARYYASNMGRFMSPDWSAQEEPVPYAKLNDPQSLNLYSYVLNHPLVGIDPDGHACDNANEMAVCHGITVAISNGMNAADALQAGQQAQQQQTPVQKAGDAINNFMTAGSDWLNNHPIVAIGLTLGADLPAWEQEQPAIEEEMDAVGNKVEGILKTIEEDGFQVTANEKSASQEANVTITHPNEPGVKLNLRTETHPIPGSAGQAVRYVNVERIEPGPKNRPVVIRNEHIAEQP